MSVAYNISLADSGPSARMKFVAQLNPRALGEIIWPPCTELTRRRLINYRNRKGLPSQGFGEQLASKTFGAATNQGAVIVINGQGARQLFLGGTIVPRFKKVLSFAKTEGEGADPDAYGKSLPEMFGGEIPPRAQRTPEQNALLKSLRLKFGFAKKVTQSPHPDLLPSKQELGTVAINAVSDAIKGGFK